LPNNNESTTIPFSKKFRQLNKALGKDGNFSFHLMIQVVPFENSLKAGSVAMDSSRTSRGARLLGKGRDVQATRDLESTKNL